MPLITTTVCLFALGAGCSPSQGGKAWQWTPESDFPGLRCAGKKWVDVKSGFPHDRVKTWKYEWSHHTHYVLLAEYGSGERYLYCYILEELPGKKLRQEASFSMVATTFATEAGVSNGLFTIRKVCEGKSSSRVVISYDLKE